MANPGSVGCSRGMAVVRAAEAMIQALGGEEVTVLFPVVALPDDSAAQLGLADPEISSTGQGFLQFVGVRVGDSYAPSTRPR